MDGRVFRHNYVLRPHPVVRIAARVFSTAYGFGADIGLLSGAVGGEAAWLVNVERGYHGQYEESQRWVNHLTAQLKDVSILELRRFSHHTDCRHVEKHDPKGKCGQG